MSSIFLEVLQKGLQEIKVNLEEKDLLLCEKYQQLLIEWNQKINLTAITDPQEVAIKHFIDSIMCLDGIEIKSDASMIDIGTGAGFPGLPIKIWQKKLDLTLLDSLNKRCAFLKEVVNELALEGVKIVHGRAEDKGKEPNYREQFDLAAARAVTNLPVLLEYCLPFVKTGGIFIALKGPDITEEISRSEKALKILGGEICQIRRYHLPLLQDERSVVIVKKIAKTPAPYPRKAGLPEKKPLGA